MIADEDDIGLDIEEGWWKWFLKKIGILI